MFFKKPDLTSGARPVLQSDETLLFVQDDVGLYEGKYKITSCQKGHAYLTSHRACYIDDLDPRNNSLGVDLKEVERHEFQARFLRSSPKITLHPKPVKRAFGSLRYATGSQSPMVQRLASSSSLPSTRASSPFRNSPVRAASPQIVIGTWFCPICHSPNPVPSNFDPTTATESFPMPPCVACGIAPAFAHVLKAAIAAQVKPPPSEILSPAEQPSNESAGPHLTSLSDSIVSEEPGTITCPRCTFHNHPSLHFCEMCNTPLPQPKSLDQTQSEGGAQRTSSPGPEIANLSLEEDFENCSIKFSFRGGGEKVFYERLKHAMIQRKWLLQDAPPVPRPRNNDVVDVTGDGSGIANTSSPQTPSNAVGIAGLEQRGIQTRKNNETVIGNAFEDLEALMASAKDVVALAEKFALESGTSSTKDPVLSQSAAALGMVATRDVISGSSDELYTTELARNLAEYIADANQGILRRHGGIMGLIDLWAIFNRSRNGVELISPSDFRKAAEAWDKLNLPIRLRQFKSGLLVVQGRDWTDDKIIAQLTGWFQSLKQSPPEEQPAWDWSIHGCGVTAQEVASRFGWSIGVASESLEMAEDKGVLCREEGVEGLKFWINHLVDLE